MSKYRYSSRKWDYGGASNWLGAGVIVAIMLLVLGVLGFSIYAITVTEDVRCTVTDKDRVAKSEGGSDMRIYTSNCGTLKVADSLIDARWDSADVYSSLKPGETYLMHIRGIRVPFLSMFPNIIEVEKP